jgi:hypothetical protein
MVSSTQAGAFALQAGERDLSITAFTGGVVVAGLANATIAAFILCRLPASHAPTMHSLVIRAVTDVACAAGAGVAGAHFYWNHSSIPRRADPPLSFLPFALANAMAWVWVPTIAFLLRQDSPAFGAFCALGAALLASSLRRVVPDSADSPFLERQASESEKEELFAATLHTAPREAYGSVVALCLYLAGYCLFNRIYLSAGAPLALAAFLFAWNLTFVPATESANRRDRAPEPWRLAPNAMAAILVTLFVLLFGIGHRNRMEAARAAALAKGNGQGDEFNHNRRRSAAMQAGISGYESIILWPVPEKKQIVAPMPNDISPFANRTAKPLVIRFNGPYWYFQPPEKHPSPVAHEARGNPLTVNVAANNFFPLDMEAIQTLDTPVRLSRCREVQVEIENRDNIRGPIELGVLLTDSSMPGKPALSLGRQPVLSSESDRFTVKITPADEVLRFPIPDHGAIRKFDQITVTYFPGAEHWQLGTKIAVEQFELLPR